MILESRNYLKAPALASLLAVVLLLSGCPLSPDSDEGGGDQQDTDLPDRDVAAEAVQFYQLVWKHRLYNDYTEVLHDDFEFFFRSDDASDFPWVQGDSWGRTDELAMAANMFDPEFVEPADSDARRVESIEMDLILRNETAGQGGSIILTYDVEAFVWFNSTDAFRTVAVFEFEVIQGTDGRWQILVQRERELI